MQNHAKTYRVGKRQGHGQTMRVPFSQEVQDLASQFHRAKAVFECGHEALAGKVWVPREMGPNISTKRRQERLWRH